MLELHKQSVEIRKNRMNSGNSEHQLRLAQRVCGIG